MQANQLLRHGIGGIRLCVISCTLLAVMIIAMPASAQQIQWDRSFGGDSSDGFTDVILSGDGSLVAVGASASYGEGIGEAYLVKADAGGTRLWEKTFSDSLRFSAHAVVETPDGGFVLTGVRSFLDPSGSKIIAIRTDADGHEIWRRFFGDSIVIAGQVVQNVGYAIRRMDAGGYLIAGYSGHLTSRSGLYLVRLNEEGELLWNRLEYSGSGDVAIGGMLELEDGTMVIAGYHTDYPSFQSRSFPVILRITPSGASLPDIMPGSGEIPATSSGFNAVERTPDGGYLLAGSMNHMPDSLNSADLYIMKTDSAWNVEWEREYDIGGFRDSGRDIVRLNDSTFVILADVRIDHGGGAVNNEVMLVGVNLSGEILWSWQSNDRCRFGEKLSLASDGSFIIAGQSFCESPEGDAMLMQVSRSISLSVDESGGPRVYVRRRMNLK